jgi:hypothetical protein
VAAGVLSAFDEWIEPAALDHAERSLARERGVVYKKPLPRLVI